MTRETSLTNRYGHPAGAAAVSARMHRDGSDETERLRKVWERLDAHKRPGSTRLLLGRDPGFDPLRHAIAAQIGKRS